MTSLFKKAAFFTDLHLGNKSNSTIFNEDCLRYANWFIDLVKTHNCDTIFFLGDFHHTRNNININTLSYSLKILEMIDSLNLPSFWLLGNHDLYYKDKRTVSSVQYIEKFKNINLIKNQVTIDDVTLMPWLVGEEYKTIKNIKSKYVLGHFELPSFLMNGHVMMPDHGELKADDFGGIDLVFTGHFHKRQQKGNVHYIGNAFPHNFADAWDDERGAMILEWGKDPVYHNWADGPKYKVLDLAQLIDNADNLLDDKTYARVNLDISISYEEANFIKETMLTQYGARELSLIPNKQQTELTDGAVDMAFESVDQIVIGQIQGLDTSHYDKKLLLDIYTNL